MQKKTLGTLLDDIHLIFEGHHEPSEENLDRFAQNCKEVLRRAISEAGTEQSTALRMSNLGTPDRKLWYSLRDPMKFAEEMSAQLHINFCYGHIVEEFLLFLIREAGHEVTHEQEEVEIDGVVGHMDCMIDGVPVDIKSASEYGFKKFKEGTLLQGDDPFGYIQQISGYANALGKDEAAFVALNKNKGEIAVLPIDSFFIEDTKARVAHVKALQENDEPPPRCYSDEPMGKSGNRKIPMPCVFCPFKWECWDNLRAFQYANGTVYLTEIANIPKVPEITSGYKDTLNGKTE